MGRYAERFCDEAAATARYDALQVEVKAARPRDLMMIQATIDGSWYVLAAGTSLDSLQLSPPRGALDLDVPEEVWQVIKKRQDALRKLYPRGPVSVIHAEPDVVRVSRKSH